MAKINLLKKEWVGKRHIKRLKLVARVIMFLAVGGFLLQTFYVTGRLVYLRTRINKVKSEIESINVEFENDIVYMKDYVWAQGILDKFNEEKKNEYEYKDYLMKINSWLTSGTSLAGVSFTSKNEIAISVFAKGVDDYRRFETNLRLIQEEDGFGFREVEQLSLSRSDEGAYKVSIRLKI